jgi:hypothetical protein
LHILHQNPNLTLIGSYQKEIQRLKQEAKELSIKPIGDSRTNHLEERGNDTIRAMKKQLLPFDLWTSYLARILFLQGCDSLFWESPSSTRIFNGLQNSF